jgi:hypothetical protein
MGVGESEPAVGFRAFSDNTNRLRRRVAEIVQRGLSRRNPLSEGGLYTQSSDRARKLLILLAFKAWLAALDDFRNCQQDLRSAKGHEDSSGQRSVLRPCLIREHA